jgi:hypothetical protein
MLGAGAQVRAHAQQADSKITYDALTKITYSSYTSTETDVSFGVALPLNVSDPYDEIISITAPVSNPAWTGFAWGGTVIWSPLRIGKTYSHINLLFVL